MINKNNETILLINSFGGGGAERQFSILINSLNISEIYCLEKDNAYIDESKNKITYLTDHTPLTSSVFKYLYLPIYSYKLFKRLKGKKDIQILAVLERSHLVVWLLSFFLKTPYILSYQVSHQSHYIGIQGQFFRFLFKKALQRSKLGVSNSLVGAQEIINIYDAEKNKVVSIPNGYDFNEIYTRSNDKTSVTYPELLTIDYILCVARFFSQKAQDKLINSFVEVKRKHKNIKLIFNGVGDKLEYCINYSKQLGFKTFVMEKDKFNLDYDVYFLNFQSNPLVYMKHAKIFAFPTYYEGLPNALIEAMICGCIPISSDCKTGPREIIAPESDLNLITNSIEKSPYGFLIEPFDSSTAISNWSETIEYILENEDIAYSIKENIKFRISEYKIDNIIDKWKNVLDLR